jgi:serine/threonine-protein kinase RsbT
MPRPEATNARIALRVTQECDVAAVIREVMRFCRDHGFGDVGAAHVATATSELSNNLWMHTLRGGRVELGLCRSGNLEGIELIVEDDGPGIADLELALTDGYTTAGGLGCGLPGARRLMDEFDIDSRLGCGTRVVARKWRAARR